MMKCRFCHGSIRSGKVWYYNKEGILVQWSKWDLKNGISAPNIHHHCRRRELKQIAKEKGLEGVPLSWK